MRPAHVLAVRAVLLGLALAGSGCFKPKILEGGFACGDGGTGSKGICPDGLQCDLSTNLCVTTIKGSAGSAGMGGAGGKAGQGGAAGMASTGGAVGTGGTGGKDAGPCLDPIANCQPSDAGMCDPVCNTGCTADCHTKCSVNSAGALTCNVPTATRPTGLLTACDQSSFGADQTDDCQPGQVCVMQNSCGPRCYQFCRGNSDCSNDAGCSIAAPGGYKMCDVPPFACDPVNGNTAKSSCPGGSNGLIGCYLSATSTATLCDCQNNRAPGTGNGSPGDSCTHSRDCFAGLVCYDSTGHGSPQCWKVCRLPGADAGSAQPGEVGCTVASNCSPILLPNGMTNPTYGFCNE